MMMKHFSMLHFHFEKVFFSVSSVYAVIFYFLMFIDFVSFSTKKIHLLQKNMFKF